MTLANYMTTGEAASFLGLKRDTIKRYCYDGTLEAEKKGQTWMIAKKEVKRYWAKRRLYRRTNA